MKSTRKRRVIEIYFILYLAALVLLLPGGKVLRKIANNDDSNFAQPFNFTLQSEKSNLFCKAQVDSSGLKILELDSINTIYYSGDVDDVHFEFLIEDQSAHQSLKLSSDSRTSTKYFRIVEDPQRRCAIFYWYPPLFDYNNKLYLVQVFATGKPSTILNNNKESKTVVTIKTQFTLNLTLTNQIGIAIQPFSELGNSIFTDNSSKQNLFQTFQSFSSGNFGLFPGQSSITKISLQNWTNELYANNINLVNDLAISPQVSYILEPDANNGGFASLYETIDNKLVIQGKTPSYGSMKVFVKITRKYDAEEFTASFSVTPSLIEQPVIPKIIYPEKTILINPRLPLTGKVKAYLKHGDKILALSNGGENISFTADNSDVGKELTFERYLDGNLYGQRYLCKVENYPDPEIREVQRISNTEVRVVTRSWGIYKGEKNEVIKFEIVDGNAKYYDLRGYLQDTKDQPTLQYFKFVPQNPDKPFEFKIRAVDRRGKYSESKSYPKE
jgi:hypothetical protein